MVKKFVLIPCQKQAINLVCFVVVLPEMLLFIGRTMVINSNSFYFHLFLLKAIVFLCTNIFLQQVTQNVQWRKSTKPCALCHKINHENSFQNKQSMSNHFDVLALLCQKIDYTMNSILGNQNKIQKWENVSQTTKIFHFVWHVK